MQLSAFLFAAIFFTAAQQSSELLDSVTLPCQINLNEQVEVPAQEAGLIKEILVKEGNNVNRDDLLVKLDDSIQQQQINVARAELLAAKTEAENDIPRQFAIASRETAYGELNVSKKANQDVRGAVPLVKIKELELNCTQMELSITKAEMEKIIAAKKMDVKQAQLEAAQVTLNHRQLLSPLSGEVREIRKHVGEWVQSGETVLHLYQMNVLRSEGWLDSLQYAPSEVINRPVTVEVQLARGRKATFPGKIVFVDPQLRLGSTSYKVRAEVTNRPENGLWLLRPNMTAKMTIQLK